MLQETFVWQHDEIQRKLDNFLVKAHDDLYDLNRIYDQQDKANLPSTDTSVFQLVPRTKILRINDEALVYLAKQLFGKSRRRYIHKYCSGGDVECSPGEVSASECGADHRIYISISWYTRGTDHGRAVGVYSLVHTHAHDFISEQASATASASSSL